LRTGLGVGWLKTTSLELRKNGNEKKNEVKNEIKEELVREIKEEMRREVGRENLRKRGREMKKAEDVEDVEDVAGSELALQKSSLRRR